MSVVGFDGIPQAAQVHPPLTTVSQPLAKMGRVATQMLLDQLSEPGKPARRIDLPTELIIRGSCQPPRATSLGRYPRHLPKEAAYRR